LARGLSEAGNDSAGRLRALRERLDATAGAVILKQLSNLKRRGYLKDKNFDFDAWKRSKNRTETLFDECLVLEDLTPCGPQASMGAKRRVQFHADVVDVAPKRRELGVRLQVRFSGQPDAAIDRHFWVGPYAFPMLDNTQLEGGLRVSVVMSEFHVSESPQDPEKQTYAIVHLMVFPAAISSFKQPQDYDDILLEMLRVKQRRAAKS